MRIRPGSALKTVSAALGALLALFLSGPGASGPGPGAPAPRLGPGRPGARAGGEDLAERPAPAPGGPAREGRASRHVDLRVKQLPPGDPGAPLVARAVQGEGPGRHRQPRPRVRLREEREERP